MLNNPVIKNLIQKLWDIFWAGGIANPLTAIEQITYLIFMKKIDDLELKKEKDAAFLDKEYKSKFEGEYLPPGKKDPVNSQTLRWSHFSRITSADEMFTLVQTEAFPFTKQFNDSSDFVKYMENAVFMIPGPSVLVQAVKKIEEIFIEIEKDANEGNQSFQDIQGDVYEFLLSEIASAGKMGQFRTPRHIIKLMADLVAPKLGQTIADPACGTAGFLLGAYHYVITDYVRKHDPSKIVTDEDGFERAAVSAVIDEDTKKTLDDCLYGYDIDTTMVRLGLMNLIMHGIDNPHIQYKDTLSKGFNIEEEYNIVMANPPFSGNIDKGDINEDFTIDTTKTELLFIERVFRMLRKGGSAAIIVPQGVLFGAGKAFKKVRELIIEQAELKAVIAMPGGVFKPYAGVATAILVFTKSGETEETWFYNMTKDGYSLDDKRTKLQNETDLPDIVAKYNNRLTDERTDRTAKYFFVPKAELAENEYDLSFSKYSEEVYDEIVYEEPEVIIEKLENMEKEIQNVLTELKSLSIEN
jgi:type I restriction enzyme M protein